MIRNARRRGVSLTETLVVITISGTLLSLFGVSLHSLFRAEQRSRGDHRFEDSLARFSRQFRADAHRAAEVSLAEDAATVRLIDAAGPTVEYAFVPPRITRIVSAAGQPQHHDAFILPHGGNVRFSQTATDFSPRLTAEIASPIVAGIRETEPATRTIEAILGLIPAAKPRP